MGWKECAWEFLYEDEAKADPNKRFSTWCIGNWNEEENKEAERYIDWIRRVYEYVTPFVSNNPRAAYLNYRGLDLGVNSIEGYEEQFQKVGSSEDQG